MVFYLSQTNVAYFSSNLILRTKGFRISSQDCIIPFDASKGGQCEMKFFAFRNFLSSILLGVMVLTVPVIFPSEEPLTVILIQPNGGETLTALKVFEIQWTTSATGG